MPGLMPQTRSRPWACAHDLPTSWLAQQCPSAPMPPPLPQTSLRTRQQCTSRHLWLRQSNSPDDRVDVGYVSAHRVSMTDRQAGRTSLADRSTGLGCTRLGCTRLGCTRRCHIVHHIRVVGYMQVRRLIHTSACAHFNSSLRCRTSSDIAASQHTSRL